MIVTKRLLAASAPPSRSAYVARLRRAFFLRVHPDRFRTQPNLIKDQSILIQSLSDRLGEPDFLRYITPTVSLDHQNGSAEVKNKYHQQQFSIETNSGMVKTSISLNGSPSEILQSMAELCNFPPPPLPPQNHDQGQNNEPDLFQYLRYGAHARPMKRQSKNTNLIQFLETPGLANDIKERRLNRINATSAAHVARQLYKFSSIDGTRLGWSSASMSICLQRLTALHDEHRDKLRTSSFYPFRLILSSDEFQRKVDLWAGEIRLNPSATSMQWLSILENVTDRSVHTLKTNQQLLKKNLDIVEETLQLRVVKGHTSDAEDYFECIRRLARQSEERISQIEADGSRLAVLSHKSSLVIESDQACRRGNLRKNGSFEVSTNMSIDTIRSTISRHAKRSNEILNAEYRKKKESSLMIRRVLHEFGAKVHKPSIVSYDQLLQCLATLLEKDDIEKDELRRLLLGHSIGISTGLKLHLSDDGTIMIPWRTAS
mmetsp:Transcript_20474/g.33698  ORF Transcript_20474/g.33698 Transcript_20474/m.33698 type:complete len:487 (+) Transcript_20474:108-1568(+)